MNRDPGELIVQFLDHLVVERDLSPNTVDAYRRALGKFATFITRSNRGVDSVTR